MSLLLMHGCTESLCASRRASDTCTKPLVNHYSRIALKTTMRRRSMSGAHWPIYHQNFAMSRCYSTSMILRAMRLPQSWALPIQLFGPDSRVQEAVYAAFSTTMETNHGWRLGR